MEEWRLYYWMILRKRLSRQSKDPEQGSRARTNTTSEWKNLTGGEIASIGQQSEVWNEVYDEDDDYYGEELNAAKFARGIQSALRHKNKSRQ